MAGMVIIGAGEAGARAAQALREHGYEGSITLLGDETHAPYERPPLSKSVMLADGAPAIAYIFTAEKAHDLKIDWRAGIKAEKLDRHARAISLSDGTSLSYDKLLLTTGAKARRLEDAPGAHYLRSVDDALALKSKLQPGKTIAIIGGGFIGLELAASARQLGLQVSVYEMAPRLLARALPEVISEQVMRLHQAKGVEILTQVSNPLEAAQSADVLVVGIGAIPETSLAESAGLTIENGIQVNSELATSDANIFAAGDCCSFPLEIYGGRRVRLESWRNAQEQGNLAARNMLGAGEKLKSVPWFWSDQFELTLQLAGLVDEGPHMISRKLADDAWLYFHLAENGKLKAASGFGPNGMIAREIRLAEMLIAAGASPAPESLADPSVKLKGLLRQG